MPAKRPLEKPALKRSDRNGDAKASAATTSARSTAGGPSRKGKPPPTGDALVEKMAGTQALAAAMPFNPNKPGEHGKAALKPQPGPTNEPSTPAVTGSTLTETVASNKVGAGRPNLGENPGNLPLDRVRTDATGRVLTTNQGVPVADNQNSLKAGLRGPALLEDFI
ncbi:MAG: catalase HPII, partial [Polyangiaceae bacterium]